jgi:hypothetical protein
MSFLTQRIANRYPHWSKIRQDPASMGQRFIEPFAETLEALHVNQLRIDEELHLLKYWLGLGTLWSVHLDEADYFPQSRVLSGAVTYTYPTVVADSISLTRLETFEEFAFGAPSRLEALESFASTSYLVWDSSAPTVYNAPPDAQRLWVLIEDSDEWYLKTSSRHRLFDNTAFIRITGVDINSLDLIEILNPMDDGLYRASHFFKEVTSVEYEGFDGTVKVYWSSANQELHTDPFRIAIFDDLEAPLLYSLSSISVDSVTYGLLSFTGARYKIGYEYRRPNNEDLDNSELLGSTVLTDESGSAFTPKDLVFSDFHSLLFVLDAAGVVHVYDPQLPEFGPPQLTTTASVDSYMRVDPLQPYVVFGSTDKLFTSLHRPRYPITWVSIKRVSPAGVITYLQGDRTWDVTLYKHRNLNTQNQLNWQEITFETTYDEMGQWEYWTTCQTENDSTISYSAVVVGSLEALVSLETGVTNATSISFGRRDELQIGNGTHVYRFTLHKDAYLAQEDRNHLVLREEYDSVEVTY